MRRGKRLDLEPPSSLSSQRLNGGRSSSSTSCRVAAQPAMAQARRPSSCRRRRPHTLALSDAYLWAGYNEGLMTATEARPKAKKAAEMAVQLDPNAAEAHASLATFKLFYEFDWRGCEVGFRRAIELNPNYGFAHDVNALVSFLRDVQQEKSCHGRQPSFACPHVGLDRTLRSIAGVRRIHAIGVEKRSDRRIARCVAQQAYRIGSKKPPRPVSHSRRFD
jgi:hypothetical protein